MNAYTDEVPDTLVDPMCMEDVLWLLSAVEEFALHAELDSVVQLLAFANPHLSVDGLARITGRLVIRLRQLMEASR